MLKIEEGKYYNLRSGKKVGPMIPIGRGEGYHSDWKWRVESGEYWAQDGKTGSICNPDVIVSEATHGPVVTETVTKTRIVPGVYGCVHVLSERNGDVVQVLLCNTEVLKTWYTADELDAAAAVLSALAKGLRDA